MNRLTLTGCWMAFICLWWASIVLQPEAAGEWFAKARAQYLIVTSR